jgi:hypothetical protein
VRRKNTLKELGGNDSIDEVGKGLHLVVAKGKHVELERCKLEICSVQIRSRIGVETATTLMRLATKVKLNE